MKLLYCQVCGDIIAPEPKARVPRFCRCRKHAVWWENPMTGELRLHEVGGQYDDPNPDYLGGPDKQPVWHRKRSPHLAYVLGLHNRFLGYEYNHSKASIQQIIKDTPTSYIFKTQESVVIRIRPGESNDTDWATELPAA